MVVRDEQRNAQHGIPACSRSDDQHRHFLPVHPGYLPGSPQRHHRHAARYRMRGRVWRQPDLWRSRLRGHDLPRPPPPVRPRAPTPASASNRPRQARRPSMTVSRDVPRRRQGDVCFTKMFHVAATTISTHPSRCTSRGTPICRPGTNHEPRTDGAFPRPHHTACGACHGISRFRAGPMVPSSVALRHVPGHHSPPSWTTSLSTGATGNGTIATSKEVKI